MKRYLGLTLFSFLLACSNKNAQTGGQSSVLTPAPATATYTPRLGVAVRTGSRTCVAIRNANLAPGTPITVVSALLPQSFSSASIGGPSSDPCPITQNVDPAVSSYDLKGVSDQIQKLTPVIAVLGNSAAFTINNNNVQADLDQNGKTESFRSCSSNDGMYLTAWSGNPLTGTILWSAHYYEPNNPGLGPACSPAETAAVSGS